MASLQAIGNELKVNPPKILAHTRAKFGSTQANKQRVAIMFSKARRSLTPGSPQDVAMEKKMGITPGSPADKRMERGMHHTIRTPFSEISHPAPKVSWSAKNGGKFGNEL